MKCCMEERRGEGMEGRREEGREECGCWKEEPILDTAGLVMGEGVAHIGEIMG